MNVFDPKRNPNISIPIPGDMSTSWQSVPIWIAKLQKPLSLEVSWPATGSPVGVFSLVAMNNPNDASGAPLPAFALSGWTAVQPNGSAGNAFVDNIPTAASYVALVYTASSGGVGAVPTATLGLTAIGF